MNTFLYRQLFLQAQSLIALSISVSQWRHLAFAKASPPLIVGY